MSEIPFYRTAAKGGNNLAADGCQDNLVKIEGLGDTYRGTSLIRTSAPLKPCSRSTPRALCLRFHYIHSYSHSYSHTRSQVRKRDGALTFEIPEESFTTGVGFVHDSTD